MGTVDSRTLPDVFDRIHAELSRAAPRFLRERGTLDVPAVVAEVYLRLNKNGGPWEDTGHFYAVACKAAGQVVMNYNRDQNRVRRGGGAPHVTLHADGVGEEALTAQRFLDFQRALDVLERTTPRLARVVACRVVAGLSVAETADALEIGTATVKRDWRTAKSFLTRYLSEEPTQVPRRS